MKSVTVNKNLFLSLLVLGISVFVLSYMCACEKEKHNTTSSISADSLNEVKFHREGELAFISKESRKKIKTIDIEIADTPEELEAGLMYRRTMADTEGMLFVFEKAKARLFWMKNTYLPLDMIFVDKDMKIVKIEKKKTPMSEKRIPTGKNMLYTVEVNAGFCDRYGINVGDYIQF
jgi:uncharacterized protein